MPNVVRRMSEPLSRRERRTPKKRSPHNLRPTLLFAGLAAALCLPVAADPRLRLVETEKIVLEVRPLTASFAVEPQGGGRLELGPTDPLSSVELALRWPGERKTTRVALTAQRRPPRAGVEHLVRLDAEVRLADGREVRATREVAIQQATTVLFELYREYGRALTLAVDGRVVREESLAVRPTAGPAVQLVLEVERVWDGRTAPLETNRLSTFVGEPVTYSFRLGEEQELESVRVRLTPLKLFGDVAQMEMEVSGALPDGETTRRIERTEQWLASRDTTSSVTVEAGEPPRGYRFLVTARF